MKSFLKIVIPVILLMLIVKNIGIIEHARKVDFSGVPDVISCFKSDDDYYLTVVTNSDSIEDKTAIEEQLMEMFEGNQFRSMYFFFNEGERKYGNLNVSVYLQREDVGIQKPVYEFSRSGY